MKKQLIITAFYALVAVLVLYWPMFHAATHIPGAVVTDFYHFHWSYWWIRHALTHGLDVYQTTYVMAPFVSNLSFHTMAAFWYPIWALLEPVFGTGVGMTGIFVAAFVLTGHIFYLLLRREGALPGLALIGGVMLQVTPIMLIVTIWTNTNLMGWFWLPALLLLWGQITRVERRGQRFTAPLVWTAVLAVALWAMILTDLQYPLFAAFLVVPYVLLTLWNARDWGARLRLVAYGILAVGLALVLLWFVGPLRAILAFEGEGLAMTPAERASPLLFPTGLIWHRVERLQVVYFALPGLLLALLAGWRWRVAKARRWFWLALVPVPLVLSLGAALTIGDTTIPMPYVWMHNLFGGMFRYPERLLVVFLIPAVAFTMLTLSPLLAKRLRLRLMVCVVALLAVLGGARALAPMDISPMPTPYAFHAAMRAEPYEYVIVDVPTGGASGQGIVGEPAWLTTQFYGLAHQKRMVNGHISRVNTFHYMYMRDGDPMMAWLGQRRLIEPEAVEAQMRERIFTWPIGYFVLHSQWIGRDGPTLQEIIGFFNRLDDLVCPHLIEGDAIVYRTAWHPDGCAPRTPPEVEPGVYHIDIGAPDDLHFIGWGWHWAEDVAGLSLRWTGAYPQTRLYVDLPPANYALTLSAQAFAEDRRLSVAVDGETLAEEAVVSPAGLSPYTVTIPAALVGDGHHVEITLDYDATLSPADVGQGDATRQLAVAVDWIELRRLDP